jgi:hypothetical protein
MLRALSWRRRAVLTPVLVLVAAFLAMSGARNGAARGIAPDDPASTAAVASICDQAGMLASQATGVPLEVLSAIALTETGRRIEGRHRAWPWTVNMEGVGAWFATREEALAYVHEHYQRGARSFDVGCFQINFRWHGNAFASIEDMFDPLQNATYAGQFLRNLYMETGSWSASAGAYHSRTPEFANRYRARFDRIVAGLTGGVPGGDLPPPGPAEYAHGMVDRGGGMDLAAAEPAVPEEPWIPPPPTRFGSVAGVDAAGGSGSLLLRASGGLF